jgi:hypothetical protein
MARVSQSYSTFQATPEQMKEYDAMLRKLGMKSRSFFIGKLVHTFAEQIAAGQDLLWPPRFMSRREADLLRRKTKRPAPPKSKRRPLKKPRF